MRERILILVVILSMGSTNAVGESRFKITTKRDDDTVAVKVEKGKACFSVHSPFGISQAVIKRKDHDWPDVMTMRLYLKGLENLKVTNGKTTVELAVSSHNDKQRVRLWLNGKEDSPLNARSQFWMEVRMVGDDGKPIKTTPVVDGYFEMRLPTALFERNPRFITINWIDFYR